MARLHRGDAWGCQTPGLVILSASDSTEALIGPLKALSEKTVPTAFLNFFFSFSLERKGELIITLQCWDEIPWWGVKKLSAGEMLLWPRKRQMNVDTAGFPEDAESGALGLK